MGEQKKLSQEQVGWVLDTFAAGGQIGRIAEDLGVDPELVAREIRSYVHRNRDEDPTRAGLDSLSYQVAQLRDELEDHKRATRARWEQTDRERAVLRAGREAEPVFYGVQQAPRGGLVERVARQVGVSEDHARAIRDEWVRRWSAPEFTPSVTLVGSVDGHPYQVVVSSVDGERLAGLADGELRQVAWATGEIVDFRRQGDLLWVFHHVRGQTISFEVPFKFRAPDELQVPREDSDRGRKLAPCGHTTCPEHRGAVVGETYRRDERATVAASVRSDPDALARLGLTVADVDALAGRREGR